MLNYFNVKRKFLMLFYRKNVEKWCQNKISILKMPRQENRDRKNRKKNNISFKNNNKK